MDEMLARRRLEIKQLQNKEAEMKKAAAEGSKAEQKAKTNQVEENDISKPLAKFKEKLFKVSASKGYNNSNSNNFKDEAKDKNSSSGGEWTQGRQARRKPKRKGQEEEEEEEEEEGQPQVLDDLESDPQMRQARLKHKMEISMKKIERSEFYKAFLKQLKSPEVSGHFRLMLGSETQLQMVIYGIGSIESDETPRFQLSIAILMKREFDWVGNDIEVFDPILSATEASVIKSLGCTVLSVNEQARREALKPTLFFMPYCMAHLYNNLLQANWRMDRLSKIALLGNSFRRYSEEVQSDQYKIQATKRIIDARRITTEFAIETVSHDYYFAFSDLSWHFFTTGVD